MSSLTRGGCSCITEKQAVEVGKTVGFRMREKKGAVAWRSRPWKWSLVVLTTRGSVFVTSRRGVAHVVSGPEIRGSSIAQFSLRWSLWMLAGSPKYVTRRMSHR